MEKILRSKEMAEIVLLPVRHHSPACAFHVERMIEAVRPEVILVEGPDNADALIPVMVHEETKAPFAIYYSYHDQSGRISEEKAHYKCYYPFLDYSPELAAFRAGKRLGIRTAFIDLSYGDILAASSQGRGLLKAEEEKSNYNDDYLLSRNRYLQQLCERTGMRNFDEFWEKYFELNGMREESERWFDNLLVYCGLARGNTPRGIHGGGRVSGQRTLYGGADSGACRAAGGDRRHSAGGDGGFHTPGLKALLTGEDEKVVLKAMPEQCAKQAAAKMEAAEVPAAAYSGGRTRELDSETVPKGSRAAGPEANGKPGEAIPQKAAPEKNGKVPEKIRACT